ncbi:type II toxin-antitoxin system RelE/ParE family toxin [Desulfobacula sp.]|uniref:type II toxin-antitoxin system RelE/ParE family toxin n=1 Tax=Desulfobacula sp. TaxID=2593537 RepID=UPI0025BA3225|nr:type II toxin-antitoxin system RelE/ParE family toxin [Desulfobacula sp.]
MDYLWITKFQQKNEPDVTGYFNVDTLSLMCDTTIVKYEIETTNIFDKWFSKIKDIRSRARIINRFDHIQLGNFGDYKRLGTDLFELRFFFSSGFRIYYTIKNGKIVFLLCGGDKSSQSKDINKAKAILAELE